jgi:DNA-binding response OmpR family regulator
MDHALPITRLLLIESTAHLRGLLYELLVQEGYVVLEAANDYEAFVWLDPVLLAYSRSDIRYLIIV